MRVIFIRHGKTEGNLHKRYIGRTDEPLCVDGRKEILDRTYPSADRVYTSTKKRCLETAELIYPDLEPVRLSGFDECDFGEFEGKNYLELSGNQAYQEWIDSGGMLPFPGGETTEGFNNRCREAFAKLAAQWQREAADKKKNAAALVVHGGTIMAVFSAYAEEKRSYYDWQIKNGEGFAAELVMAQGIPLLRNIVRI